MHKLFIAIMLSIFYVTLKHLNTKPRYKRTSARRSSPSVVNQQRTRQELVMSDRKLIYHSKILHNFSPSAVF